MEDESISAGPRVDAPLRRDRRKLSLALAAAMIVTVVLGDIMAHSSPVIPNHVKREQQRQHDMNGVWLYDAGYLDEADYLLLGQIPNDDYSRGGVYFIGDSQTAVSLMAWRLPPEEQALIHNYGVGALRHRDVYHLVRMLVEDFNLLQAGGEKTTLVLGLSYYLARPEREGVTLKYYVERHHLYSYDERGMHPAPLTPLERMAIVERDYVQRFLATALGARQSRVTVYLPDQQTAEGRLVEGDWRAAMHRELGYLAALLDYLRARDVNVVAFFPPSGSWEEAVPYEAAYREAVMPLLEHRGVQLIDQGDWLADADFADGNHPTYAVQLDLHERNRAIALEALQGMGLR